MSFQVGQTASISETMTEEKVREFARLTGDTNPLHLDEKFAQQTRFGRRIVHGAMVTGLLSKLAGTKLPGPGAAVLSAQFAFKKPCYVGDTITARIEIKRYRKDKPLIFTSFEVRNQNDELLVEGESTIYWVPPVP